MLMKWTYEEFKVFIKLLEHKPMSYVGFQILYNCGLKIDELLALSYQDVDLVNKTLNIKQSYQRIKGIDIFTEPKTEKSERIIDLSDKLVGILEKYLQKIYKPTANTRLFIATKSTFEHDMKVYSKKAKVKK